MITYFSPIARRLARPTFLASTLVIAVSLLSQTGCQMGKSKEDKPVRKDVEMFELRREISSRVSDPQRSAALLILVESAEKELAGLNVDYLESNKKFAKMSANHKTTASELNEHVRAAEVAASNRRLRLADLMLAMKERSTPEEWPALSNAFINSVLSDSDRYRALQQINNLEPEQ